MTAITDWQRLCGQAVELVGGQEPFRREVNILKRLVKAYGAERVEIMLSGAKALRWRSLKSLGSAEGLGRRMAEQAYWQAQNQRKPGLPESVKAILRQVIQ